MPYSAFNFSVHNVLRVRKTEQKCFKKYQALFLNLILFVRKQAGKWDILAKGNIQNQENREYGQYCFLFFAIMVQS